MKKGFTLIELLIVIAIITILALIAIPNFLEAQIRATVARVQADMRSLATGIEAYMVDYNNYPLAPRWWNGPTPRCINPDLNNCTNLDYVSLTSRSRALSNGITVFTPLTTPVAYLQTLDVYQDPFWGGRKTPYATSNNFAVYPGFYFVNIAGMVRYMNTDGSLFINGNAASTALINRFTSPFDFRFHDYDTNRANTSYSSWNRALFDSRPYPATWSLASMGPDKTHLQQPNSNPQAAPMYGGIFNFPAFSSMDIILASGEYNMYDPSNGTQSVGDIWRFSSGMEK